MYKIESGEKCPDVKSYDKRKYCFKEMAVGDTFKVPIIKSERSTYMKLNAARWRYKCKAKNYPIIPDPEHGVIWVKRVR